MIGPEPTGEAKPLNMSGEGNRSSYVAPCCGSLVIVTSPRDSERDPEADVLSIGELASDPAPSTVGPVMSE
jgi:hypothetical protein